MSVIDTAWLRMDAPDNPMTIVGIVTTATPLDPARLRRLVGRRLLGLPRFRQRPVPDALGGCWQPCRRIDLGRHVVTETLPAPAGDAELADLAARLASEPLDASRPRWQIHVVERFGPGSACVLRVHHCYADGAAMIRVLQAIADPVRRRAQPHDVAAQPDRAPTRAGPAAPLRTWLDQVAKPAGEILGQLALAAARWLDPDGPPRQAIERVTDAATHAAAMATELARVLSLPDDPGTPLRGAASGRKCAAWATPLDLDRVRAVAHALECTINDVLMAAVAGAIGAWLRETHGIDIDGLVLRASMPVDLRGPDETATSGNKFGLVFVDLPVGESSPVQRVQRLHATLQDLKSSLQPATTLATLALLGTLPAALQSPTVDLLSRKTTLVASNVRGPPRALCLAGQRIDRLCFWVPQAGSARVGVSLLSYAGKVFFGIIADRNVLAEPELVAALFLREFAQLAHAAAAGPPGRGRRARRSARPRRAHPASDDGLAGST
jgi:diacylglycerol O-acyltransferase